MTHFDLCKLTAERFLKKHKVVIYEYQSFATMEYPDVLCFDKYTTLFEIKVDYQDFKKDRHKECRVKHRIKYFPHLMWDTFNRDKFKGVNWKKCGIEELIKEAPHLGKYRYYVCPSGLIQPDEINNGWGLYWYNGKFMKKKESKVFRNNIHDEMSILTHAFRKYACGDGKNILVNKYKE